MTGLNAVTAAMPRSRGSCSARTEILTRIFEYLKNPRVRHKPSGVLISRALHPLTAAALLSEGVSESEIKALNKSIFDDADHLRDFETVRDAPPGLFFDLKRRDELCLIVSKGAVPVPGPLENRLICLALAEEFTRAQLLSAKIFREECSRLIIDIDDRHGRQGFFVPIFDGAGAIVGIRVFRHPRDERPFRLRARRDK